MVNFHFENIAILPQVKIFDIYNYHVPFKDYSHATFRDVSKMEGYSMAKDGYVLDIKFSHYSNQCELYAVLGKVIPRTQDKDPLTKLKHYNA